MGKGASAQTLGLRVLSVNSIQERSRLPTWPPSCLGPPKPHSGWGCQGAPALGSKENCVCSQRCGRPPPSPRAWGVPWAGLAQAWRSGCALCPGTSRTKKDLLKGQRSSQGAGTPAQPWQLARVRAVAGTPTLRAEREKAGSLGCLPSGSATQVTGGQDASWQFLPTGRRRSASHESES